MHLLILICALQLCLKKEKKLSIRNAVLSRFWEIHAGDLSPLFHIVEDGGKGKFLGGQLSCKFPAFCQFFMHMFSGNNVLPPYLTELLCLCCVPLFSFPSRTLPSLLFPFPSLLTPVLPFSALH